MQFATGFMASKVLLTSTSIGLFTYLNEHPNSSAEQITAGLSLHSRGILDTLDCLTGLGFLNREGLKEKAQYSNAVDADTFLVETK